MIQKQKGTPYYLQLAEYLIEKIENSEYRVGEKIPSESELSRQFHVNRHTVRQAVARVTSLGWITTQKGRGSYVEHRPDTIVYRLSGDTYFSYNMKLIGKTYQSRLLAWEAGTADPFCAQQLQIVGGEPVYELTIQRFIDDVPFSMTTTYLPQKLVPGLEAHLERFQSLTDILNKEYGIEPLRSRTVIGAAVANCRDAAYLELPDQTPILRLECLSRTAGGLPVEVSVARIRGDMAEMLVDFPVN